jgi:hypothetical protein
MTKITLALQMLSDGQWHKIKQLQIKLALNETQMQKIIGLLEQYGFASVEKTSGEIRVNEDFQKLLVEPIT